MSVQPDLTIRSGGVEFFGQLPVSGVGFVIDPDGLEGLDDGVASKGDTVSRPGAHGDFDVPGFLDSRIVSISGNCLADTPERLAWLGSRLTGFLAEGAATVTFDHMGRVLWGRARRAPGTAPKFKVNGMHSTSARFQVQLKFANPRLFGETRIASGPHATPIFSRHYGNFPATPVLTITGSMPGGYAVYGPNGAVFGVTAPVVPGVPHTIDSASGLLRIGGVVQYGAISVGIPWTVPGGASVQQSLAPVSGSGMLSVATVDTFI